jgi:uncharacterized RDD family membrane protein YckC
MNPVIEIASASPVSYPSLVRRFQSMFIDTLVIIISMVGISALLNNFQNTPNWVRVVLFVFLFGCYEPVFMAFTKGTIGNRLIGIQVKQFTHQDKKLSLLQAYLRFMFKLLLGWISFLTMHFNPQKRAIHDMVANSVMIQK